MKFLIVFAAFLAVVAAKKAKKNGQQQAQTQAQKVQDFCGNLCNAIEGGDDIRKMQKMCFDCTQLYAVSDDLRTDDAPAHYFRQ